MNIQKKMKEIDKIEYCDSMVLDFIVKYIGDEAILFIENSQTDAIEMQFCWAIKFLQCFKVTYETDAGWIYTDKNKIAKFWREQPVKNLRGGQLFGYAVQSIELQVVNKWFTECRIVIANMSIVIICRDIEVHKVLIEDQKFFWDD